MRYQVKQVFENLEALAKILHLHCVGLPCEIWDIKGLLSSFQIDTVWKGKVVLIKISIVVQYSFSTSQVSFSSMASCLSVQVWTLTSLIS